LKQVARLSGSFNVNRKLEIDSFEGVEDNNAFKERLHSEGAREVSGFFDSSEKSVPSGLWLCPK
jgi:hypothetical protein